MTSGDKSDTLSKLDVGTLATWRTAGISRRQLYTLVNSGQLVKIRHGVYATGSALARAGFEVVHVTWQELFRDPARVAGRIRRAFWRAERLGLGR